jgi:hypothetical protein
MNKIPKRSRLGRNARVNEPVANKQPQELAPCPGLFYAWVRDSDPLDDGEPDDGDAYAVSVSSYVKKMDIDNCDYDKLWIGQRPSHDYDRKRTNPAR